MPDVIVDVYVQIRGNDIRSGRLYSHRRRGKESASFTYADDYLSTDGAYSIDPQLPMGSGTFHSQDGRAIFGAFTDCAPDRWGRRLIHSAERRKDSRSATRSFGEIDYLLGVRDDLRQGALRFRDRATGNFIASDDSGVPPLVRLPTLLAAAANFERDPQSTDEIDLLLHGGSSLGGARPKAHVITDEGHLAIAKFPSVTGDEWNVMAWEKVALTLAERTGIHTPVSRILTIEGKDLLILDRFDRVGNKRIGYASAMTLLEASDGDQRSYLEIAEVIERFSDAPKRDLVELWRRIILSILISNTDDHLRNHGFLRSQSNGWRLSPVFDINPNPQRGNRYLSTAIDFDDTTASVELAMSVAPYFRVQREEAIGIVRDMREIVAGWQKIARDFGIAAVEIELMAPAFEPRA